MSAKHFIKVSVLTKFFDSKQLQRGKNGVDSGHIVEMSVNLNNSPTILKGKVSASMKNKTCNVEIHLDKEDGIIKGICACPRGLVSCHHIAALCIYARDNVSVTDAQCSWYVPSKVHDGRIQTIRDLVPPRNPNYVACSTEISEAAIQRFKDSLSTFDNAVGFTWLLSPEPTNVDNEIVKSIEHILYSDDYTFSSNKAETFSKLVKLSEDQISSIVNVTLGQSSNMNWLVILKHRLTASHFGAVLSACKLNRHPPSLFKSLMNEYNLEGVKAIQWGRENKLLALKYLEEQLSVTMSRTGLWVDECGYLGATPDGLVGSAYVVEAKCPYKLRNASLTIFLKNDKSYIVYEKRADISQIKDTIIITKYKDNFI